MSTSDSQPDDARTQELVAYLDGELPDEAARRVEERLAVDDDYRRQLGELDQAWSALEVLPTPTVDDKFARTTIEMVTLAAERDLSQISTAYAAARRRRLTWAAACGLALVAAGFAAARLFVPSQNRALMADLPVVARVDELSQIGDVEFLRSLSKLDIQQFSEDDTRAHPAEFDIPSGSWEDPESRRQWVEHLSADQKAELAGRLQRFQSLPGGPDDQRRMRQLEEEVIRAPDSAVLQRTLAAYGQWLSGRTSGQQAELRGLASADRLKRVKELVRETNREAAHKLTSDEEQSLRDAITKFVDQHRPEYLDELRRDKPEVARQAEKEPKWANMMIMWWVMRDEKLHDELQAQLAAALGESNRQYLEHLQPFQKNMQMGRWVRMAMNPKYGPQELERFFSEKLTNDQREQLLNLPQVEMETQLDRWYAASQLGIPERDWAGFDMPARFGRGGPGIGRPARDRDDGPRGRDEGRRGREEDPPHELGPRRFNRGPGGPPDGPPSGGPPPGGPSSGGPGSGGPPREGRSRPGPPPEEQDQPPPEPPPAR